MISKEDLQRLVDEGKVTLFLCPNHTSQAEIDRLKHRLRDFLDSEKEHRRQIARLERTLRDMAYVRDCALARAKWGWAIALASAATAVGTLIV